MMQNLTRSFEPSDVQAILWNMDTLKLKSTLEEHSLLITDVRFSPNSTRLATSSFDKTVRVWDADNVSTSWPTLLWSLMFADQYLVWEPEISGQTIPTVLLTILCFVAKFLFAHFHGTPNFGDVVGFSPQE